MKTIKTGFNGACRRAKITDLRPYDLRHTFATRLLERGVHQYVISALMGHSASSAGAGLGSRMTSSYAHVNWEIMVRAVEALEEPIPVNEVAFGSDSGKIPAIHFWPKKQDERKRGKLLKEFPIDMVGAWGFEPQTPTVSTVVLSPLFATVTNVLRKNDRACIASDA
jgi:hypothetical protein